MVEYFALTEMGITKHHNEDRVVICDSMLREGEDGLHTSLASCAAVFDGVSQGGWGTEAASLAAGSFAHHARHDASLFDDASCEETVSGLFDKVQVALMDLAKAEGVRSGIMATASGIVVTHSGRIVGFNVGDSRVYRLRAGMLLQMSEDHSFMRELFARGASDELLAEMGATQSHVITRALGIPTTSEHVVDIEGYGEAQPGDLFLGCTDGIYGAISREDLKATLMRHVEGAPLREIGRSLLEQAINAESTDDMTLFLMSVTSEGEPTPSTGGPDDGR